MRILVMASLGLLATPSAFAACLPTQVFCDVGDIPAPTNAVQLVYAPNGHKLYVRNSGSAIAVVDLALGGTTFAYSNARFFDMSLAPSGNFVFASDYAGENIGYGTPLSQHYAHRFSVLDGAHDQKTAYLAGHVQAVDDTHLLLKNEDQWVRFFYDEWGADAGLKQLNPDSSNFWTGYYCGCYDGDFRFDYRTNRVIHGNSGSSSDEIAAWRLINDNFTPLEESGTYGSAQGYGGPIALATDGSVFYYGRLQVEALDVTHNLHVFPASIAAATGDIAFSSTGDFYDAHTAAYLGTIGFATTVYALNPKGRDFWAFDSANNMLRHFQPYDDLFNDDFE